MIGQPRYTNQFSQGSLTTELLLGHGFVAYINVHEPNDMQAQVPVHIVPLLWVERSATDRMRAMVHTLNHGLSCLLQCRESIACMSYTLQCVVQEQKYALARPADDDLLGSKGITPGSSGMSHSLTQEVKWHTSIACVTTNPLRPTTSQST